MNSRLWGFGLGCVLLAASALGYNHWNVQAAGAQTPGLSSSSSNSSAASTDAAYYSKLVFAANEMFNQIEQFDAKSSQGKLSRSDVAQGRTYADSLMSVLNDPPEELIVSQAIADDLYSEYSVYIDDLLAGTTQEVSSTEARKHYELFRQNAALVTLLSSYSGVNVECH
jgi:hypothetical protein